MYPGEYGTPIPRTTTFQVPMVSGYVTARLLWQGTPLASGYQDYTTQFLLENTGGGAFTVQVQQTTDRSSTGLREALGNAISLVPGGRRTVNMIPGKPYLEFKATATTSSADGNQLRAQLTSKLRWNLLGFDELDPFYPTLAIVADNGASIPLT